MGQVQQSPDSDNELSHPLRPASDQLTLFQMGIKLKNKEDDIHKSVEETSAHLPVKSNILRRFKPIKESKLEKAIKARKEKQLSIDKYIIHPNEARSMDIKNKYEYTENKHSFISYKNPFRKPANKPNKIKSVSPKNVPSNDNALTGNLNREIPYEPAILSENLPLHNLPRNEKINCFSQQAEPENAKQNPCNLQDQNYMVHLLTQTENPGNPTTATNENNWNQLDNTANFTQGIESKILQNIQNDQNKQIIIENIREIENNESQKDNKLNSIQSLNLFPEKTMADELKEDIRIQKRKESFLNPTDSRKPNENICLKSIERIKQMRIKSLTDSNIIQEIFNNAENPKNKHYTEKMIIDTDNKQQESINTKIMNSNQDVNAKDCKDDFLKEIKDKNIMNNANAKKKGNYLFENCAKFEKNNTQTKRQLISNQNGFKYYTAKYYKNPRHTDEFYAKYQEKFAITLIANDLNLEKLNRLLYKLNHNPTYNIIDYKNGLNKIVLFCKNKYVFNIVKRISKKWINYIIKPSYHQNIIDKDRPSLKNIISQKKLLDIENTTQLQLPAKTTLNPENYKIIDCKGDGNCLFRAVSVHIYRTQEKHYIIRKLVTNYIQTHKYSFAEFIDENFEEYISKLSQNRSWAGDVELEAISELYAKKIEIYKKESNSDNIYLNTSFHESITGVGEPLRLLFSYGHYDSIILKNPKTREDASRNKKCNMYHKKGYHRRKNPFRL